MKTETYFLADGNVVELPFEPDDAFVLAYNNKFVNYHIKDNKYFVEHDNGYYEVNPISIVNSAIETIQAVTFHLDNISNKETIDVHAIINVANALNNIKKRTADYIDWNND